MDEELNQIIDRYKLSYFGKFTFYPPYWINNPGVLPTEFKGKASPEQIQQAAKAVFDSIPTKVKTAEEAKFVLLRAGIGIDCSAFIYHTLCAWYKRDIIEYLYEDKSFILESAKNPAWKKEHELTKAEVDKLPQRVPLTLIVERFNKKPQNIVNIARLISSSLSIDPSEAKCADIVYIKTIYGDHGGVIVNIEDSEIMFADSGFDPVGPGGIGFKKFDSDNHKIYRLKV